MPSTEGQPRKGHDSTGIVDAVPDPAIMGDQPTAHEPPVLANAVNVPSAEDSFQPEFTDNIYIDEPRGPPVPPKDSRSSFVVMKNGVVSTVKNFKGSGPRENGRSTKSVYYSSNDLQHFREQGRRITELEKLLADRAGHISDLERQVNHNQIQLREQDNLKQELFSIRQHLRLEDQDEPWVIAKRFDEVNKRVDDIAVKFGKLLCGATPLREFDSADLLEHLLVHQGYNSNLSVSNAYPIQVEDFIELGCQAMLNKLLIDTVLNRNIFNPEWDPKINKLFQRMYEGIQAKEAQVNAGRWRISTFQTIPNDIRSYYEPQAKRFCDEALIPFSRAAYDVGDCVAATDAVFPAIVSLMEHAYSWNHHTRSTVLMLDFQAVYYPPGSRFDNKFAKLDESETKLPVPERILLTSQLGLSSYKALGKGEGEYIYQTKAKVLGNGYFNT